MHKRYILKRDLSLISNDKVGLETFGGKKLTKNIKVLLPTYKPGGLGARIYPHWKDAPTFTVVTFNEDRVLESKVLKLETDDLIINLVKKENINEVITLSLSTRALELLNRAGVMVLTGKIKNVKEAIDKYRRKELYILSITKTRQNEKE